MVHHHHSRIYLRIGLSCGLALLAAGLTREARADEQAPSPAQTIMARARASLEKNPANLDARNELALALARRARETGDPSFYDQAEEVLKESLRISPDSYAAERVSVWILLGKHEFARALEKANALNARMPDDVFVYALMADANVELGHYEAAEKAAQWSLDMRPGEISGITRAAYLRELFGDIDGAIELMGAAYGRTAPGEVEDRAWLLTQLGHLHLMCGKLELADKLLHQAYHLFPRYHYTVAALARLRTAQKKYKEAVAHCRDLYKAGPSPENLYLLAETLERAGETKEAEGCFATFEKAALAESGKGDNANRELIYFYIDHAHKPAAGLRLAESEMARRQDVHTLRAYAWALCASGRPAEGLKQMDRALEVGIRDAGFYYHAGVIAERSGDVPAARRHLRASLDLASQSEWSDRAEAALARLDGAPVRLAAPLAEQK